MKISLKRLLGPQTDQLFRVRFSWLAQDGLSHYPASDEYLYATRRRLDLGPLDSMAARDPLTGEADQVCEGYNASRPLVRAPFAPVNSSTLRCASPNLTPALKNLASKRGPIVLSPVVELSFELPLNISAIDPEAEAKLVGLRRAMVSGRYLSSSSRPRLSKGPSFGRDPGPGRLALVRRRAATGSNRAAGRTCGDGCAGHARRRSLR